MTAALSPVVKYHGLGGDHLMPLGFLMRPLLNGGTLARQLMITREQAALLATQYLERHETADLRLALLPESTTEFSFGWLFFYNSEDFIRMGDPMDAVGGNAPLLVERETGRLFVTGTALPTQAYVDRYLETGDPHGEVSRCVLLDARPSLPDKLPTIRAIRELTGLAISDAKAAIDQCLNGAPVTILAPDADAAGQLIARLGTLGWNAKRHYEPATKTAADAG
jgi:Immunity protein 35